MNPFTLFNTFHLSNLYRTKTQIENDIEELEQKFRETKNLPRKEKKQIRKKLNFKYNLLLWELEYSF